MTSQQRQILEALSSRTEALYGLDLIGMGAASRCSLYVELGRLEDRGWIVGHEDSTTPMPRRLYRITPAGAAMLLPAAQIAQIVTR